jgi:RNA polymerase sigma-70 factor (ECF subfamily)
MDGSTSATLLGRLRDLGDAQAWRAFEARYRPRLLAWCGRVGLQDADAQDLTQDILTKVALRMRTFVYEPGKDFSGWLHAVWRNAWLDSLRRAPPGGCGSGDSGVYEKLGNLPCPADALEEEFDREVLHEALARVQRRVKPRDWTIFHDLVFAGKTGTEVAGEFSLTLAAVGMIKLRVQRKVRGELALLSGDRVPGSEGERGSMS